MSENKFTGKCPIWETPAFVGASHEHRIPVCSPRAGGWYEISAFSLDNRWNVEGIEDDQQRARLTSMLIDRRRQGDNRPYIDDRHIKESKNKNNISVYERANRLLKFLVIKSKNIGDNLDIKFNLTAKMFKGEEMYKDKIYKSNNIEFYQLSLESMAWSESLEQDEVESIIEYLKRQKLLDIKKRDKSNISCRVSIEGYRRVEENILNPDSAQVFVAMWFGNDKESKEKMNKIYKDGIEKAIEDTGYKPLRIDQKEELNKIDDEIIAEIRRSRFLIADYTHGDTGPRGGVYYEAGFAEGLGIPVIRSCQSDQLGDLHFDTRQYYHIEWETPEELRQGLQKRILATPTLGKGPGATETVS